MIISGISSIDNFAFYGCKGITSVTIQNCNADIWTSAFEDCTGLSSLTIGEGVISIGVGAFCGCTSLEEVAFPDSLEYICTESFENCTSLKSVTFGENFEWDGIAFKAFYGCSSLKNFYVSNSNQRLVSKGEVLFNQYENVIVQYPTGRTGKYTMPSGVQAVNYFSFYGCTGLTEVIFPDGFLVVFQEAFNGCTGLTGITLPSSFNYVELGAFYNCSALTAVNYDGNSQMWSELTIEDDNECLTGATVNYSRYLVTVDSQIVNGTVVSDKEEAAKDTVVTLTVTPVSQYMLDSLTVKQGQTAIATTPGSNNTHSFKMPGQGLNSDVT